MQNPNGNHVEETVEAKPAPITLADLTVSTEADIVQWDGEAAAYAVQIQQEYNQFRDQLLAQLNNNLTNFAVDRNRELGRKQGQVAQARVFLAQLKGIAPVVPPTVPLPELEVTPVETKDIEPPSAVGQSISEVLHGGQELKKILEIVKVPSEQA